MDFTKILKITLPIVLQFSSVSYFASNGDHADSINNTYRYMIKLNDSSALASTIDQEDFIHHKINNLINHSNIIKHNVISDIKIQKIIDNLYTVETDTNIDETIASAIDENTEYLIKDRVGYFNPEIENAKKAEETNVNFKSEADDHTAQWSQFSGPAGINLESKPFANDGAWSYWHGDEAAKRKNNLVVVGVLDTGLVDNSNLNDNILPGWNFSGENNDVKDETISYHGTHVAGIIAAHGPKVYGVATGETQVKPNVKILPIKIPKSNGMFYESNVVRGIYWAIGEKIAEVAKNPNPAKVLNMSFGIDDYVNHQETEECSPAVQKAINKAVEKNVVIVVAAGNNNANHDLGSPGGCKNVLRIASTGPTGLRSYFSNYGEGISFAAPGGDKTEGRRGGILSTVKVEGSKENAGLAYMQGTSMAAPQVSGLVALIHALNDDGLTLTYAQIEELLAKNTHEFGKSDDPEYSCVGVKSCGTGIIDADKTLKAFVAKYYPPKI